MGCLECLRKFSQAMLIITNAVVGLLGLAVLILGSWAQVNGRQYFDIVDNASEFTGVGILLIVVGLFVMILGIIGVIGGIFATTVFGRITLGLYAVVLALLILCEIAGGIAAGVKRGDLNNLFTNNAKRTFNESISDPSKEATWDTAQRLFHCCGVESYRDYQPLLKNDSVPASCCYQNLTELQCNTARLNVTADEAAGIFKKGCIPVLIDGVDTYLGAIAAGGIIFGLFQIFGVVMACFVAIYKDRENRYEVV